MKKTVLSARNLCKSFAHNGGQLHILTQVNLDLYEGDFTVIMGQSGSGKSTLLYSLSGMDRATSGEVVYNDEDVVKMNEKKLATIRHEDFGFIFQQMYLVSNLTLFENVAVPGYLNKEKTSKQIDEKASGLLDKVGLTKVKTHLPKQVSGGEQQRCAIARAVINEPKLLFADEPTGALNRKNTKEVLDLLTNLNENGQSILMVTHDMKAALRANRVIYLEDGNIVGELTLPPYKKEDEKSRETQLNAWLTSLEW
ncbi:ABC transporter ATP-binding protein [Eubacterium sp.]|uniref:ABC transporter ATP-binding protein n=1 Tax=Eubacterium sp. TaxID=142586 RepID=UPI0025FC262A|nr:ABC transporter ATP-binding protein [Eubacterium sp.]MCR5628435.1 ABC transporter ATP-binding protein [Eubacterium sp.]